MTILYESFVGKDKLELIDICNLKPYISSIMDKNFVNDSLFPLHRDFPFQRDLEDIYLSTLEEQLKRDTSKFNDMKKTIVENEQIFETEVSLGDTEGYIRYLFPIPYVEAFIKQANIKPQEIYVEKLYEYTKYIEIDLNHTANLEEPVIVLEYPYATPGFFILDGNHRISEAYKKGVEKYSAFVFSKEMFYLLAPAKIFSLLLNIHHNLSMIYLYLIGDIVLSQLKEWYKPIANEQWVL